MIIDAHHHLWIFNEKDYGWMDDSMEILRRDYLPLELESQLQDAGVSGTVIIQSRQNLEETRWLLELADKHSFIKGVVGWVDLRTENLTAQLDEFAAHPKLVGVRHILHDEPKDDFMLQPEFIRGIENLRDYDLTYDLLLFPKHLRNALKLVSQFPEQKFVLDHISKPRIKPGLIQPWKTDIEALVTQANVWCKISGMVTEADHTNWKQEDFIPYIDVITSAFGTDRVMLGSDWPVCRLAGEYKEVFDIPLNYFESYNENEKMNIFENNCIDFYGLEVKRSNF